MENTSHTNEPAIDRNLAVMPSFFDVKGREITDGCTILNPADSHPKQVVKVIDNEFWFGAKGTAPSENNDWCKMDKRFGFEKFWLVVS